MVEDEVDLPPAGTNITELGSKEVQTKHNAVGLAQGAPILRVGVTLVSGFPGGRPGSWKRVGSGRRVVVPVRTCRGP